MYAYCKRYLNLSIDCTPLPDSGPLCRLHPLQVPGILLHMLWGYPPLANPKEQVTNSHSSVLSCSIPLSGLLFAFPFLLPAEAVDIRLLGVWRPHWKAPAIPSVWKPTLFNLTVHELSAAQINNSSNSAIRSLLQVVQLDKGWLRVISWVHMSWIKLVDRLFIYIHNFHCYCYFSLSLSCSLSRAVCTSDFFHWWIFVSHFWVPSQTTVGKRVFVTFCANACSC